MHCDYMNETQKQRPLSSAASHIGNHAILQLLRPAGSSVIQRVPQLWRVALAQAEHLAKDYFVSYRSGVEDYNHLMDCLATDKKIRKYMGFSKNIFDKAPHNLPDAKTFFENCIRVYFGDTNVTSPHSSGLVLGEGLGSDSTAYNSAVQPGPSENSLLGTQLDTAQTSFSADIKLYFPYLTRALKKKPYGHHKPLPDGHPDEPREHYFLFDSTISPKKEPPQIFNFTTDLSSSPFSPSLTTSLSAGKTIINRMFQQKHMKTSPVDLSLNTDAARSRLGRFDGHVYNTNLTHDQMSVFDYGKCRPQLTIPNGTVIPNGTKIPAGKARMLRRSNHTSDVQIPDELRITKGTFISPNTVFPPPAGISDNSVLSQLLLSEKTLVPAKTNIPLGTVFSDEDSDITIPPGFVIKSGTIIPKLTKTQSEIPATNGRTVVHEFTHQAESALGVEDMVTLYRGLYARTANISGNDYNGNPITEPGIITTGQKDVSERFGLNLLLPDMKSEIIKKYLPGSSPATFTYDDLSPSDKQSFMSQEGKYAGSLLTYFMAPPPASGAAAPSGKVFTSCNMFGTEFLSTTAELLATEKSSHVLVTTDPLRAALFFKIANPHLYGRIKKDFQRYVSTAAESSSTPAANIIHPIDLDILLHTSR